MPEKIKIEQMPKNPYLLAYFTLQGLRVGDEWVAADYIIWIDKKLDQSFKNKIWEYPISIVEIDPARKISEIKELFYRLNLTN